MKPARAIALLAVVAAAGCQDAAAPPAGRPASPASASGEWVVTAEPVLPTPVTNNAVVSASVGGREFVFSFLGLGAGRDVRAITKAAYALDVAAGTWEVLPEVPGPVGRLASTAQAVDGRIYLIGGYTVAADGTEVSVPNVDVFEPATRRYTSGAAMPVPVDDSVSGVWRGRLIYLVSGWSMKDNVNAVQIYDPSADRWTRATPIPGTPVFGHAGGIVDDVIVYCGGAKVQAPKTPKYAPSAECWQGNINPSDPAAIVWRAIAHHPGPPRYRAAAGPIRTGTRSGVLFTGGTANPYNYNGIGYDGRPSEPLPDSWIFDPGTGAWTSGPAAQAATMDHRGIVTAGGAWWTVGGFAAGQTVTAHVTRFGLSDPR